MKTHALLRYFLTAANLAAALALLPPHARAEDKPPSRPKPPAPTVSRSSAYDLEIVDGTIQQGPKGAKLEATLANVVDAVRDRYREANIVMSPGLAHLKIADLKLRTSSVWEELEAIRVASGGKFEWVGPESPVFAGRTDQDAPSPSMFAAVDPTTGLSPRGARPNSGLFTLRELTTTPETARTVEAFNIGPYLQWLGEKQDPKEAQESREKDVSRRLDELEEIVGITLDGLKQGASVEMPRFLFHRGANLLVVTGTRDAVEVARKVVNALPGQSGVASFGGGGGSGGSQGGGVASPGVDRLFRERYGLPPGPSPTPTTPAVPAPPR